MLASKTARLTFFTCITFTFFLVELIVGYVSGSVALVADAFHMLSDVLSSVIAIVAIRLAATGRISHRYSFGFQRAEVLGALINAVFLLALCFNIFIEAAQRFWQPHEIEDPKLVLIVGSIGLGMNIIGLFLFHDHHHHGHGHSHGHSHGKSDEKDAHSHSHHHHHHDLEKQDPYRASAFPVMRRASACSHLSSSSLASSLHHHQHSVAVHEHNHDHGHDHRQYDHGHDCSEARAYMHPAERRRSLIHAASAMQREQQHHSHDHSHDHDHDHSHDHDHGHAHGHSHNMHGVFLHVLGDALGSVAVIVSSLVIWLATGWKDRQIIDPIVSLLITAFIAYATVPLVKSTCLILLQGTPQYIGVVQIKRRLLRIPDVDSIHELHVWQLNEGKVVASVHVRVRDPVGDGQVSETRLRSLRRVVERVFCDAGVHSVTVQLEVWDPKRDGNVPINACLGRCARRCEPDAKCCDPEGPEAEKLAAEENALVKEEKDGGMLMLTPEDADDDGAWKAGARVTGFFHAPTRSPSPTQHQH